MTLRDLENALEFLRSVCARGDREEVLVKTVTNIENYVRKAKHDGGNASGNPTLASKV
jgi:hypothetical protein